MVEPDITDVSIRACGLVARRAAKAVAKSFRKETGLVGRPTLERLALLNLTILLVKSLCEGGPAGSHGPVLDQIRMALDEGVLAEEVPDVVA